MAQKHAQAIKPYNRLRWAVLIGVVALAAAYALGSRALDTGSLQQYFLTLALLVLAVNRFGYVLISLVKSGLGR